MRKIYIGFILVFIVLAYLDTTFVPKQVKATTSNKVDQNSNLQSASFLNLENPFQHTKPDTLTWKLLGEIKYVKKPSKDYPDGVMFPIINSSLKQKGKKKIVMSGFIIPIDNVSYALSKNVFASCFFCGQAGPETIMGIKFKGATPKLKTDQYVTLEGVFRYNDNDVNDWIYHVDEAVIVKGAK
ncbi:hypothetical protein [Flavobacterium orientale]|uniref:DUF3299 domain-containing protein n=1 Tax=Flavobacterium orientale TaxID=1756020 RepID=A0A916Y5S1_9FLAO|nr:hypothetical protein [Flavobacterium orientale]GGD31982.1 hypothetical protein GCM10011343_22620 [Flavobacterium orientale]